MTKDNSGKFQFKDLPKLLTNTYKGWISADPYRLGAVIAYYAVISLPGLMVILINIVGAIWGPEIVQGQLTDEIAGVMGSDTADAIKTMIAETQIGNKSLISTIIGIATIIYGSTGVFFHLQISLNKIWEVDDGNTTGIIDIVKNRARSFGFILVIGFLLLISFIITSVISALTNYISEMFPNIVVYLLYLVDWLLSVGIVATLFAMMFKYMPDVKISWRTVWTGAIITALLFVLGKFLLGLYFGQSDPGSTYGAAGSIVLILLWVSYSALIFFFGAEFTKVYSRTYNMKVEKLTGEDKDKFV